MVSRAHFANPANEDAFLTTADARADLRVPLTVDQFLLLYKDTMVEEMSKWPSGKTWANLMLKARWEAVTDRFPELKDVHFQTLGMGHIRRSIELYSYVFREPDGGWYRHV